MPVEASSGNVSKSNPRESHSPCKLPGATGAQSLLRGGSVRGRNGVSGNKLLRRPSAKLRRGNDGSYLRCAGSLNSVEDPGFSWNHQTEFTLVERFQIVDMWCEGA